MQYISCILKYLYYICWVENIKFKLARIEKGLSQQDLADLVGATRQTIGLIEKGKYIPSPNLSTKIAKALNRTLNETFWKYEEK